MSSSNLDRGHDIPQPRRGDTAPRDRDPGATRAAWRDALSRAAETWAMFLGAAVPPSPPD